MLQLGDQNPDMHVDGMDSNSGSKLVVIAL